MNNTGPTAATRTVTLTVAIPEGARWMTTDRDGTVCFWPAEPKPKPIIVSWHATRGGYAKDWLLDFPTNIPCPHWRDTLIDLAPEPATEENV